MFERLSELRFTEDYVGVVMATVRPKTDTYEKLRELPLSGVRAWYFEHPAGALWIAEGGQHADGLTRWLRDADLFFARDAALMGRVTTMLAAVIRDGAAIPNEAAHVYRVDRRLPNPLQQILGESFTIYLPHSDELLVLTTTKNALRIDRAVDRAPEPFATITPTDQHIWARRVSHRKPYDPIEKQIDEVLGTASDTAYQAALDLVSAWEEVMKTAPPADIRNLSHAMVEDRRRIEELLEKRRASGRLGDALADVDRYARSLLTIRRTAVDLHARVRDYQWPPRHRTTYERVATAVMLRAIQRYATDLAQPLALDDYRFLPVVGNEFAMSADLFPSPAAAPADERPKRTVVIEVPAEVRLRLGALPMIAHAVAATMTQELDEIAVALASLERDGDTAAKRLIPSPQLRDGHSIPDEMERHHRLARQAGKEIAKDLIASAIAGEPYVYALARFSIGNLGEFGTGGGLAVKSTAFKLRLAVCLGILKALGVPTGFSSSYLTGEPITLPDPIVRIVEAATEQVKNSRASNEELADITAALRRGDVVEARPSAILTALWRAVANRSGYLHEIAALVSVAGC
jgi:hypothetical protein